MATVNTALRVAIVESGILQGDIAERIAIHSTALSAIVRGRRKATPVQQAKLAKLLKRKVADLFPVSA